MRLPPLNAVRAFDAVARLGSVRAAAEELAVTPAAVSQQLGVLEAHLGIALTERQGRGMILTDSGRSWHGEIARHLRAIALAAERVRPGRRVVQITAVPSFASRWLMPRLPAFMAREPEIEVRIDASPVLADLARDPFDLAIREGRGIYPEAEAVRLFPLEFYAVASPAYVSEMRTPSGALDWSRARLLHEIGIDYWPDWVAANDIQSVDVARGMFFSHTMLALDSAIDGQGVALTPLCLADREIRRGSLMTLDPRSYATGTGIHLAWPRRGLRSLSPAATAFRDWVIDEAAREESARVAGPPGPTPALAPASLPRLQAAAPLRRKRKLA